MRPQPSLFKLARTQSSCTRQSHVSGECSGSAIDLKGCAVCPLPRAHRHRAARFSSAERSTMTNPSFENPTRCKFDPKTLLCTNGDGPSCLTAPQVAAAQQIYAPAKNPRTGQEIFPGMAIGGEKGWAALAGGPRPLSIADDHYKFVVFKNPDWDFKTLNFDKDLELADRIDRDFELNAYDPNLKLFAARGGEILMYHGWNDQLIAPTNSINYLKSVESTLGGTAKAADTMRLFMVLSKGGRASGSPIKGLPLTPDPANSSYDLFLSEVFGGALSVSAVPSARFTRPGEMVMFAGRVVGNREVIS